MFPLSLNEMAWQVSLRPPVAFVRTPQAVVVQGSQLRAGRVFRGRAEGSDPTVRFPCARRPRSLLLPRDARDKGRAGPCPEPRPRPSRWRRRRTQAIDRTALEEADTFRS